VGAAFCALLACGGGASSEVSGALRRGELDLALRLHDAQGGRDHASLVAIAEAVLEREADSGDRARSAAAFSALRQAGTAVRPVLERLARDSPRTAVRARALALLAGLGDADARSRLGEQLGSADPEVAAAAVSTLDPADHAAALCARLEAPAAAVRLAAVQRLARAPQARETQRALARAAQHDPELAVRSGALAALARQGDEGARAIEARLADPDRELRAAAAAALVSADPVAARGKLAPLLAGDVTPEGIDAARALLAAGPGPTASAARALLTRAAGHTDAQLRGRAACSLPSLPDPALQAVAVQRAAREPVRSVRLCFAFALHASNPARARLLRELTVARDVPAAQAAAELGRGGDTHAPRTLVELLARGDAAVRRVAVRALARDLGRSHQVRSSLRDQDAGVRIAAAAAIVAIAPPRSAGRDAAG
jgi:HEAT repeat protein